MNPLAWFRDPPIWVAGAEPLVQRVVAGLRREQRPVRAVSLNDLAGLTAKGRRTLILADPPSPADLIPALVERLGTDPGRRRAAPLRLILIHQAEPPPSLPELDPPDCIELETFALEDRAARVLLARWPLHVGFDPGFGQRPHLLVAGFAPPARAVLVQALRLIPYGAGRPRVTVAVADPRVQADFSRVYPQAGQVAEMCWSGADLPRLAQAPPVTQVLVCPDPSADAGDSVIARVGTIARRLAADQGVAPPILLELGDQAPDGVLADWDGQTFPFSYLDEACRPAVLLDGQGDALAQSIHEHYTDSIAAQGRDPDRESAGQPWSRLTASYRDANRHQADHLGAKLAVMDCRAVPEERVGTFTFAPLEAERLAVIEHLRWAADRHLDGWGYAPVRDNARRYHPQLIPYPELSEPMKDLDRFAVRGVPTLLARSGLGVVRMLILGIPQAAADGRVDGSADRAVDRLAAKVLGRLAARYPDRTLVIATTLADSGSRQIARLALDRAAAGLFLLCPQPITQILAAQPGEPERLDLLELVARAERRIALPGIGALERWLAERAEIQLILAAAPVAGVPKQVVLDLAKGRVDWGFEY
ncbi:MAG TPA: RyR domain-containing protein [Lamprocystis sp. (in: g-proteobacteria)]|nr:RyR domain-containing protein [Lamprocystis sp. (in: g-proteobacteria)]